MVRLLLAATVCEVDTCFGLSDADLKNGLCTLDPAPGKKKDKSIDLKILI